ncbi:MAG: tRNA (guanosine(46)-N7)-methyltransferase TrmB [Bacteroidota bacterium]
MKFSDIDFDKYPFPKRVRHHVAPNLYFPASELKEKPSYYPPLIETIDWSEHFAECRPPDALDVGCGKGRFLLRYALANPVENVLGVEIRRPLVRWINEVARGETIANASAVWYSVVNGLDFIADEAVGRIFYLFPDPWPKKRHQKRRAFSDKFLTDSARVLRRGGELFLATDVAEVDEYHRKLMEGNADFETRRVDASEWGLPPTDKETFCIHHGIDVYRLVCRRK